MGHLHALVHPSLLCKADLYSHSLEEDMCSEDTLPLTAAHVQCDWNHKDVIQIPALCMSAGGSASLQGPGSWRMLF